MDFFHGAAPASVVLIWTAGDKVMWGLGHLHGDNCSVWWLWNDFFLWCVGHNDQWGQLCLICSCLDACLLLQPSSYSMCSCLGKHRAAPPARNVSFPLAKMMLIFKQISYGVSHPPHWVFIGIKPTRSSRIHRLTQTQARDHFLAFLGLGVVGICWVLQVILWCFQYHISIPGWCVCVAMGLLQLQS